MLLLWLTDGDPFSSSESEKECMSESEDERALVTGGSHSNRLAAGAWPSFSSCQATASLCSGSLAAWRVSRIVLVEGPFSALSSTCNFKSARATWPILFVVSCIRLSCATIPGAGDCKLGEGGPLLPPELCSGDLIVETYQHSIA